MQQQSLLACADDFGLHPSVDDAVLELAAVGRLGATSCLVQGSSFRHNVASLLGSGLQRGLHLNFTEALPGAGLVMPLSALIRACWLRRLDPASVRDEIRRQLDLFEDSVQAPPDYIDGHQHVHQFPVIRETLLAEMVRRYGSGSQAPWLRCTRARRAAVSAAMKFKAAVISTLGAHALCRQARALGYRQNVEFLGVYDFQGGETAYSALLKQWLEAARDGDLIMAHPALGPVPGDPLGMQRKAEFDCWRSGQVGEWLARLELCLAPSRFPGD